MTCYLLHFSEPIAHARHYLGWSPELLPRLNAHRAGKGARLTEVAVERGRELILVRVWPDTDRSFERQLKRRKNSPQLCPICAGEPVQMPLLASMPAYVPAVDCEVLA